jgi:hypothetical protein
MPDNQEDTEPSSSTLDIIKLLRKLGKDITEENINALIEIYYMNPIKEY